MKHKHMVALLCGSMICLAACQNESEELPAKAELSMSVVARIGDTPLLQGRYAGTDLNNVEFANGDAIGIFMDELSVVKWTYESLAWEPQEKVYWPEKENSHTFRAFYPYTDADSYEGIPMPTLLGQTGSIESVSKCDFLVASTTQSYGEDGVVSFQGEGKSFCHISSLVHLEIKASEDLSTATLTKVSLVGTNIVAPTSYSFAEGVSITPDNQSDLLELEMSNAMSNGDLTLYLVVNEKLSDTNVVTLTLEYTVDGKNYIAQKVGFADNIFQGGMQQSYTITVKNRTVLISGSEISPWEQGSQIEDIIIDAEEKES